jgi:hypothetical protein
MSNMPAAREAQAPTPKFRPWRILRPVVSPRRDTKQQFRIRVERAVAAIARSRGCLSMKAACRHVGLDASKADKIVAQLCDERGIARRRPPAPLNPIKLQRAVWEIARSHRRCSLKSACRAVGFKGREARRAERIVAAICDERGIARVRSMRVLLPHWTKTCEPVPAYVPSSKGRRRRRKSALAQGLRL